MNTVETGSQNANPSSRRSQFSNAGKAVLQSDDAAFKDHRLINIVQQSPKPTSPTEQKFHTTFDKNHDSYQLNPLFKTKIDEEKAESDLQEYPKENFSHL